MATAANDPFLNALVNDFGGNYAFALDLLEQYRQDRAAVDVSWREYFDKMTGGPAEAPPAAPAPATRSTAVARTDAPGPVAAPKPRGMAVAAILPGDIAQPIRGGALRLAENMEASLAVPTATSLRTMPMRTLEENRRIINKHRDATGKGKISFTHLVSWAILRTLEAVDGSTSRAADLLQISARKIQYKLKEYHLERAIVARDRGAAPLAPAIRD